MTTSLSKATLQKEMLVYHIEDVFELSTRRLYHNDTEPRPYNVAFRYIYSNKIDELCIRAQVNLENDNRKRYLHVQNTDFAMWTTYLDYHTKMELIKTAIIGAVMRKAVEAGETLSGEQLDPNIPVHSRLRINRLHAKELNVVELYRVSYDTTAVMQFIMTKIRAARTWNTAVRFDNTYSGVEWRYFRDHIKYRQID